MPEQNYELAPKPGQTAAARKAELDSARFVAVRNLAYMVYKKPDGQPLMTYQETLEDRERVKQVILMHEAALGLIDGAGVAPPAGANGVPAMAPAGGPPAMPQAAPMPGMMAPAGPPQQMAPVAPYATPAAASPQQVAAIGAAPAPQDAPAGAAPTGRKRRTAAGGAPAAAPAGAPAPMPGMAPAAAPAASPSYPGAFPGAPAGGQVMLAPPGPMPAATGPAPQPGHVGPMPGDMVPVMQHIDATALELGRGLTTISGDVAQLKATVTAMAEIIGQQQLTIVQIFAAVHHIYGSQPGLLQALQAEKAVTLDDFRRYLTPKYTGNPK